MALDELRARYLRDRVMTATPAQRVVMLYDRLALDLTLADSAADLATAGGYLSHANQVIAELLSSLDVSAGGPAENLSSIYPYLLNELIAVRGGAPERLAGVRQIVTTLRDAWAQAADLVATGAGPTASSGAAITPRAVGGWVS
jgi:flagellar protein FliS